MLALTRRHTVQLFRYEYEFRVKEFAALAGVTVRTLQYYDKLGLLKPSGYRNSNHRIYEVDDLIRLQQILTFKYLGMSLSEIRELLDSPSYDLGNALKSQRKAIDGQIGRLQKVVQSLDRTIDALGAMETKDLDWKLLREVITGVVASERWSWVHDYYSADQKKVLEERGREVTPQQLGKWQRQWGEVMIGFQRLMDRKLAPQSPEAQRLAEKAEVLVRGFTQGDKGIEQSLGRAYADLDKVPPDRRPFPLELQRFMSEACAVYRKVRK